MTAMPLAAIVTATLVVAWSVIVSRIAPLTAVLVTLLVLVVAMLMAVSPMPGLMLVTAVVTAIMHSLDVAANNAAVKTVGLYAYMLRLTAVVLQRCVTAVIAVLCSGKLAHCQTTCEGNTRDPLIHFSLLNKVDTSRILGAAN